MPQSTSGFRRLLAWAAVAATAVVLFSLFQLDIPRITWRRGRDVVKGYWIEKRSGALIADYLRDHKVRKLQIGAGFNNRPHWLNTDIEPVAGQAYLDATHRFPLPDGSIHYITSEHVIEHISYDEGLVMLRESYRVLAPGGRVRVATPNLDRFLELFQDRKTPEMLQYISGKTAWHEWETTPDQPCYVLNRQLHEWGHRFVYTPRMLRSSLEAAGFRDIREFAAGESGDPALRGMETRAVSHIAALNQFETMVFEAVRP